MQKKFVKVLALIVAVVFILGTAPFYAGFVALASSNPDVYQHTRVNQAPQAFSSRQMYISNHSFNEPNVDTHTTNINGWTETHASAAVVSSIINTRDFVDFRDHHNLINHPFMTHNPGNNNRDDNILALANQLPNGMANVGFKSSELNLHADGYFMVSVDFYAIRGTSAVYMIPATPISDDIVTSIPIRQISFERNGILAANESMWRTATFFIRTDARSSMSFNLGLFLGTQNRPTSGVVYYDNAQALALSQSEFYRILASRQIDQTYSGFLLEIDLREHEEFGEADEFDIDIFDFSPMQQIPFGTNMRHATTTVVPSLLNFEETNPLHSRISNLPRDIMLLSAIEQQASMTTSIPFTIERNTLYMISFYTLHNGQAHIRLHENGNNGYIDPFDSGFLPVHAVATDSTFYRNNWVLNTIFVTGDPLFDIDVNIAFWIGTNTQNATGWLLVDDFSIIRVSNNYFVSNDGDANTTTIRAFNNEVSTVIANSHFNFGTVATATNPFPLVANSWDLQTPHDDRVLNGIVNTDPNHWSRNSVGGNYGNAIRPGAPRQGTDANNNVFMFQNLTTTHQTLTSQPFPLHRNTYNIISFDVARHTNHSMVAYAVLEVNGQEISRIDLSSATAVLAPLWQTFEFGLHASEFATHDATISFILGTPTRESRAATIFVNRVIINQVNSLDRTRTDTFADLTNPLELTHENGESIFFGTNNTNDFNSNFENGILNISTNGFQSGSVTTTLPQDLESYSFYEYTVVARVIMHGTRYRRISNVGETDYGRPYFMREPSNIDYGVNMHLQDFDGGFFNLKPEDFTTGMPSIEHSGFASFRFFIRTGAASQVNLTISFGTEYDGHMWRETWATVQIREINLRSIDISGWEHARDVHRNRERNDQMSNYAILTEALFQETTPPGEGDRTRGDVDWLIIVSSVIMAVAILIAVAGFLLRRTRFNFRMGKRHTSYANDTAGVRTASEIKAKKAKPSTKSADGIKAKPTTDSE